LHDNRSGCHAWTGRDVARRELYQDLVAAGCVRVVDERTQQAGDGGREAEVAWGERGQNGRGACVRKKEVARTLANICTPLMIWVVKRVAIRRVEHITCLQTDLSNAAKVAGDKVQVGVEGVSQ